MSLYPKWYLVQMSIWYLDNNSMRQNKQNAKSLGRKIKKARRERELTQEKLAEKVGISTAYMGFIEQGRYVPSMHVLQRISRQLKIKVSELIPF